MKKNYLSVTIILITWNVERTISVVLEGIRKQNYPKELIEIIAVDGNSTDKTLNILKKSNLGIKIIQSEYPKDPEACRGVGLRHAKNEIICFIDSDNYLPNKDWLNHMINPFIENPEIVGSEPMRFGYVKNDNYLNRYFTLIGSCDPVGLYLGKADKSSYATNKWQGFGKIIKDEKSYFIIELDKNHFPTLGSNGFCVRRKMLLKAQSDPKHYFHTDVLFDLVKMGHGKYAVVRETIIHDTATKLNKFLRKRIAYMKLHYEKRAKDRRYKVFDPSKQEDVVRIILFIFLSMTFIQPLFISVRGYLKFRDSAWFVHPIFCFLIMSAYSYAILSKQFKIKLKKIYD